MSRLPLVGAGTTVALAVVVTALFAVRPPAPVPVTGTPTSPPSGATAHIGVPADGSHGTGAHHPGASGGPSGAVRDAGPVHGHRVDPVGAALLVVDGIVALAALALFTLRRPPHLRVTRRRPDLTE